MRSQQDVDHGGRDATTDIAGTGTLAERSLLLSDVFDVLPYGIMVVDRRGRAILWNRELTRIPGFDERRNGEVTCCELLGCRTPGSPLEEGCITELVVAARNRTAEIQLEPPGAPWSAVSVMAAPVYADCSRIAFQIRPATTEHSRRAGLERLVSPLRIFTLGSVRVEGEHTHLHGGWLAQRPGQLLKYLVCERRRVVPTDVIAEAIWPHASLSTSGTVRHLIYLLREKLEPGRGRHEGSHYIRAQQGGYGLNMDTVWVDADACEEEIRVGMAAFSEGEIGAAKDHLERALALYGGDFLPDEPYAEWALLERERLHALLEKPLRVLAELSSDDPDRSAAYFERLAEMEPFDNEVQRGLISLWLKQGRKSRAVRHYHAFQLRLLKEFGEEPSFALSDLVMPRRLR